MGYIVGGHIVMYIICTVKGMSQSILSSISGLSGVFGRQRRFSFRLVGFEAFLPGFVTVCGN